MAEIQELHTVPIPTGYRSSEAASFVSQLDDQTRRLMEDTRGLTPDQMSWQPAPGMNTIGMLLAHIATVEVWWTSYVLEGVDREKVRFEEILGITGDDDGMPLEEGARPPAILDGRDLPFFDDLLDRARTHLKQVAAQLGDDDLTRTLPRPTLKGKMRIIELRWALYHMLEHFAGHYGQILLLKHAHEAGLHVHENGHSGHNGARKTVTRSKSKRPKRGHAKVRAAKAKRAPAKKRGRAKPRRVAGGAKRKKK